MSGISPSEIMEVIDQSGRPDVAEIFVGRMRGKDGPVVEFVDGLDTRCPREEKWIVNISTQFGCPVGCIFCDAGGEFRDNLSRDEMLAQAIYILHRHPDLPRKCGKLKVHFARMGEPSLNDEVLSVIKALPTLPELEDAPGLWCCVPTIAPKGRERWFEELRALKNDLYFGRFQLQFSCNSTDEEERKRLMPFKHCTLDEVARTGERFYEPGDRLPVLNFALAEDVDFDVKAIAKRFDPAIFAIKITPLNPTARGLEHGFKTILRSDSGSRLSESCDSLQALGYDVIISIGDGREDEIGSNCGQAVRKLGLFGDRSKAAHQNTPANM